MSLQEEGNENFYFCWLESLHHVLKRVAYVNRWHSGGFLTMFQSDAAASQRRISVRSRVTPRNLWSTALRRGLSGDHRSGAKKTDCRVAALSSSSVSMSWLLNSRGSRRHCNGWLVAAVWTQHVHRHRSLQPLASWEPDRCVHWCF